MPTSSVRLIPMCEGDFPAYCTYFIEDYARDLAGNQGLALPEAHRQAELSLLRQLPQGIATPDHRLLCILPGEAGPAEAPLGYLWHAIDGAAQASFIYDFYIHPPHRGRGHGKAAMAALEAELKSLGIGQIRLRVAHDNPRALALYRALGFAITGYNMAKNLLPAGAVDPSAPTDDLLG